MASRVNSNPFFPFPQKDSLITSQSNSGGDKVTSIFQQVQEYQLKEQSSDLSHQDLGAINYYKGANRPIPSKKQSKALLEEIQEYADLLEEPEITRYLLLQFAKMIFTADGRFNLEVCHTVRSYLQKGLRGQLSQKLEEQVGAVVHYLIQNPAFLDNLQRSFDLFPQLLDLMRTDLGLKATDECTHVNVKCAVMLYLFHSGSLKEDNLQRLIKVLQTGRFCFEGLYIPIEQIWETCRKVPSPNHLSTLSTAITQFFIVNTTVAKEPWRSLSGQLFFVDNPNAKINVTDFQVSIEGHSCTFPFTGHLADFKTFTKLRRLYYLAQETLVPIDTFTNLGTYLGDSSEAFKQKMACLVASQNRDHFTPDWYCQHDAIILIAHPL